MIPNQPVKVDVEEAQDLANIKTSKIKIGLDDIDNFIKDEIKDSFYMKFSNGDFEKSWSEYKSIPVFLAKGNIYDLVPEGISKETHYVLRLVATWHVEKALNALKFDTDNDDNLKIDTSMGNIGTAGRIAKIWAGNTLDSENIREYGDGRFTKMPRLAAFPASEKDRKRPVTVNIENAGIGSVCSHHFLPFSITNDNNSRIVISYIPKDKLLGLSKIGRFVEWCLNRPSLQEEVTALIHEKISKIAETEDVYVGLFNIVHSCETTRGAKQYSTTTTEDYSGVFDDPIMRSTILDGIK